MKWSIIFAVFSLGFILNAQDTIIVRPGYGIDSIAIGSVSLSKVKRKYPTHTLSSGKSIYCGTATWHARSAMLIDTANSIWFIYKGELVHRSWCLPRTLRLETIRINGNCSARLTNGIAMKQSTIYDVLGAYGDPHPESYNCTYLEYGKRGISFRFNDEGTLVGINLFAIREE